MYITVRIHGPFEHDWTEGRKNILSFFSACASIDESVVLDSRLGVLVLGVRLYLSTPVAQKVEHLP